MPELLIIISIITRKPAKAPSKTYMKRKIFIDSLELSLFCIQAYAFLPVFPTFEDMNDKEVVKETLKMQTAVNEKRKITESLFGSLPDDVTLEESMEERRNKI